MKWDVSRQVFVRNVKGIFVTKIPAHAIRDLPEVSDGPSALRAELRKMRSFKGERTRPYHRGAIANLVLALSEADLGSIEMRFSREGKVFRVMDSTGVRDV